jgi:hypothetical protein
MKPSIIISLVMLLQSCTLFEKDEKLLKEHVKNNGEKIRIYYVGLGATTNDVIQVRKEHQEKPLKVFEKYNALVSSQLIDDTILQVVLNDTGYFKNTADTFSVNIK